VARELCAVLKPATAALLVAGSLRRRKPEVGDIEILFIPRLVRRQDPTELFPKEIEHDETELALWKLLADGVLAKRESVTGRTAWGPQNKLAVHVKSGIPVDLFTATRDNWWNLVVCRTGSAEHNVRICEAAQAKGWKWNPYGAGFYDRHGTLVHRTTTERDVLAAVGLPWREPWERNV
jgi:DNA polymerase/3'-5' exonuclease PolX